MKSIFLLLVTLSIFTGCASKKSYLLINNKIVQATKSYDKSIGIHTIKLPQYLMSKEIPYLVDESEILYLKNSMWGSYLDEHLTNRVVNTLQSALNSPKIYQYPQNSPVKPDTIIQITIHKFIADKNSIKLEASWKTNGESKRFSTTVPIKSQDDIIKGMNSAFKALEIKLIDTLK
jgi:uncharacterized lipoprotein YmbA